jgi:uncharacterized protein YegL
MEGKKMKKDLTELVFILDRSGSMTGLESDTIGGFNAMLKKQKEASGEALVSTVIFDDDSEVIHDRRDIKTMEPLTDKESFVRGSTALLDAVGYAIHHIGNVHKYCRDEDRPENTLFVITTDGMENASRRFRNEDVKKMIEKQKTKYGWEFIFLGANIDAAKEARRFGIDYDRVSNYHADAAGVAMNFEVMSENISKYRSCKVMPEDWNAKINEDYETRKKK